MTELIALAKQLDAPWLLLMIIVLIVAGAVVRIAAESYDTVAKVFGPLGRKWQESRDARLNRASTMEELRAANEALTKERDDALAAAVDCKRELGFIRDQRDNNAWTQDLRRQVEQLSREMTYLRHRGEMNDAYLRMDDVYHRWDALGRPGDPPEYVSYVEFERRWIAAHGRFDQE